MITTPITEQTAKQEWNKIIIMDRNNGFPEQIVHKLRNKLITKRDRPLLTQSIQQNKRYITFTYHSPSEPKVTNLFKRTNLQTAFRPTNTIYKQLSQKSNNTNPSGIYQLKCNTCKNAYVGQSGKPITTRYKEHLRYIKKQQSHICICHAHVQKHTWIRPNRRDIKIVKTLHKRHENELLGGTLHAYTPQA
jgi:hypothetical protein